jgi:G3E family GTPase
MNQSVRLPSKVVSDNAARIEQLITLIDELIEVVIEENEWLAQGLPASRSKQIMRKVELADVLKKWTDEIKSAQIIIQTSDEKLRTKFKDRMDLLKAEMDENIVRLKGAIEASRRRIEAVMLAIREQSSSSAPYTPVGRAAPRSVTLGTNIRA